MHKTLATGVLLALLLAPVSSHGQCPDCALAVLSGALGVVDAMDCFHADGCFTDDDCPGGFCGDDPVSCDAVCIVTTTSTSTTTTVPPLSVVAEIPDLEARVSGGSRSVVATADGSGGFLLVWSNLDSAPRLMERVVARAFDASAGTFGEEIDLTETTDHAYGPITACRGLDSSFRVAWADELRGTNLPDGTYTDIANVGLRTGVTAAGPGPAATLANEYTMGWETPPDIGCLAGGGFVVAWRQTCSAIERRGIVEVVFRPDECDFGPPATRVAAPAESIRGNPSVAALAAGGEKVLVKTGHTG